MKTENITPAALKAAADGNLENFVAASTPGGIEAQEAQGQRDFVANETLPIDCPKDELEKLGFVFGDPVDDIFVSVQIPEGWTKKPSDHSMWSYLLDDKGRQRASIFYKAAFYDRNAHMKLDRRFSFRMNYDLEDKMQYQVFDSDKVIFSTDPINRPNPYDWDIDDSQEAIAKNWLAEKYPDWENVSAYWD